MKQVISGQIVFPLLLMIIYWLSGYYNKVFAKSRIESFITTLSSTLVGTVIIYFVAIIDDPIPDRYSNYQLVVILELLLMGFVGTSRMLISTWLLSRRQRRKIWKNVAVIGSPDAILDCINRFNCIEKSAGLKVVGAVATDGAVPEGVESLSLDTLAADADRLAIDNFILALPGSDTGTRMALLRFLYRLDRPILAPAWYDNNDTKPARISNVAGQPLTDISSVVISESTRNIKRVTDVAVSALALIVLSPAFLVLACVIKLSDGGPVFFSQERIGRHGRKFRIHKFRTMVPHAEPAGPALSSANDPRVTRPGAFMRKYRIDELPQFWNVIKGEMSLVGPRPEREYFEEKIISRAPEYVRLHQLRPGITSWGMVKYGYASDVDEMLRRMHFDLIYLENVSIAIDLKILFYTVNTVLTGKGV